MRLYAINLSHAAFQQLRDVERLTYIRLAGISNEVMHLHVLLLATYNSPEKLTAVESRLKQFQHNFYLRLLCGLLWEGYKVTQTSIMKEYHPLLSEDGRNAVSQLHKYFNQPRCIVREIRDKFAFHANLNDTEVLNVLSNWDREQHQLVFGEMNVNTFYADAELVRDWAMTALAGGDGAAVTRIFTEINETIGQFATFTTELLQAIVKKVPFTTSEIDLTDSASDRKWFAFVKEDEPRFSYQLSASSPPAA
jgi:hypothetical protein